MMNILNTGLGFLLCHKLAFSPLKRTSEDGLKHCDGGTSHDLVQTIRVVKVQFFRVEFRDKNHHWPAIVLLADLDCHRRGEPSKDTFDVAIFDNSLKDLLW